MSQQCAVCLDELGKTNVMTTECGHTFCATCIIKNLHHSNKCPMCRTVLDTESNHGGRGNGNLLPIEEVEENANVLIDAMDLPDRFGRQIFNAYGSDWESIPSQTKTLMTNIIRRGFLNFAMDFHMFIHPEDYDEVDNEIYSDNEAEANADDADDADHVDEEIIPTRQNTIITRPVELNVPELSPEINDLVRNLDRISDEPTRIRDSEDHDTEGYDTEGHDTEDHDTEGHDTINIINNTIINDTRYQIINWDLIDRQHLSPLLTFE